MSNERTKSQLDSMVENTAHIFRSGYGIDRAEPSMFAVIELIRATPELKNYFLARIAKTLALRDPGCLDSGVIPQELIELVAHEMKWEELRALAEKRVNEIYHGNWPLAAGDIAQRIVDAFSAYWPDREFYARYRKIV